MAPGGVGAFQVPVSGSNLTAAVTLSFAMTNPPAGLTSSFDTSTVPASGGTANLSLTTTAATPTGTYPFTVTGTSGAQTMTANGTLVVQTAASTGSPTLQTISPKTIITGQVTVVTVTGQNLQNAAVTIPTAPAGPGQPVPTGFPNATVQSVSADGTSMQVAIDATPAGTLDYYNLAVGKTTNQVGQFRVLPPGPIVDSTSPGTAIAPGGITLMSLVGAHLRNVTVTTNPPELLALSSIDTSEDDRVTALIMVPANAANGTVTITLTDPFGQSCQTYIDVDGQSGNANRRLIAKIPTHYGDVGIYFHPFRQRRPEATRMVRPGLVVEDRSAPRAAQSPKDGFSFSFAFSAAFNLLNYHWQTAIFENQVNQVIGSQAMQGLGIGQQVPLSAYILSAYIEVDAFLFWNFDSNGDFTAPTACLSLITGGELPGVSKYPGVYNVYDCFGDSSSGTTTGSTSQVNLSSDGTCAQVAQVQDDNGTAIANVTQDACCDQPISIAASGITFPGTYFAESFDVDLGDAITTSPAGATCNCPSTISTGSQIVIRTSDQLTLSATITNPSTANCTYNVTFNPDSSGLLQVTSAPQLPIQLAAGQSQTVSATVSVAPGVPANVAPSITVNAGSGSQNVGYCVIPDREASTFFQWDPVFTYAGDFSAQLSTSVFNDRTVIESEPLSSASDTCYVPNSGLPNFTQIPFVTPNGNGTPCPATNSGGSDGSCWVVGQSAGAGAYGTDTLGFRNPPTYYTSRGATLPCEIAFTQQMYIDCPWNPVLYHSNQVVIDLLSTNSSQNERVRRDIAVTTGNP